MAGDGRGPVKVVIIDTQYVETDARSFQSVVQKLTGKDSVDSDSGQKRVGPPPQGSSFKGAEASTVNVWENDQSIREFDRLLKEKQPPPPPSLDGLPDQLWDY